MTQTRSGEATAGDKHKLDDTVSSGSPPAKAQKREEKNGDGEGDKMRQTTLDESLNGSVLSDKVMI